MREAQCQVCKNEPAMMGYRIITGIEKIRGQGGANMIMHRRERGGIGEKCLAALANGADPLTQDGLF